MAKRYGPIGSSAMKDEVLMAAQKPIGKKVSLPFVLPRKWRM